MVRYEQDVQVAKEGARHGVGSCQDSLAGIQPSLQPEEVHTASALRLPCSQGFPENRLSRPDGLPARLGRVVRSHRAGQRTALYYLSKGGSASFASIACGRVAGRNGRANHGPQTSRPLGGDRLDRAGISSRKPLFHSSQEPSAQPLANHAIHAISEAWPVGRLLQSRGAWLSDRPRAEAGYSRLGSDAVANKWARADRMVDGRRRLRQRIEPSDLSGSNTVFVL